MKVGSPAHGEAHVAGRQVGVDLVAERSDLRPLFLGVGQGHARRLVDTAHGHGEIERDLALVDAAGNRRRARRLGRAGEGDVALAGEEAGSRVEADPARAREVDLAPGVEIGEVLLGARRTVEGLLVGLELDEITRDEARRQAGVTEQIDEQPAGIATGARSFREGFLGGLHARLQPDEVLQVAPEPLVDLDEEIDRAAFLQVERFDEVVKLRGQRPLVQVRRQLRGEGGLVLEREFLGVRFEEEVERVVHRHLGHEVDLDLELGDLVRVDDPREVVAERVLLPVDEGALGRRQLQRVAVDPRAAMRRRAQADDLGPERHGTVVAIARAMVERDVDGHRGGPLLSRSQTSPKVACGNI